VPCGVPVLCPLLVSREIVNPKYWKYKKFCVIEKIFYTFLAAKKNVKKYLLFYITIGCGIM
jgi:hypothetical protein